ncbi:putative zinc transporter msc2 [Leucoagaricus gongylophorus]
MVTTSMSVPDARTRNKISLNPTKVITNSIPSRQIPKLVAVDVLFVVALQSAKERLLDFDMGVFWVVMRVLACGGLGVLGWEVMTQQVMKRKHIEIEWSILGMAGVLVFLQQSCLFMALYRLSSFRTLMFAYFAKLWVAAFLSTFYPNKKTLAVAVAAGLSLLFDSQFSPTTVWRYIPGYGALVLHGLVTSALDHTLSLVAPSLGETFVMSAAIFVASIVALPFYAFKTMVLHSPLTPTLPLASLAMIPMIAYMFLFRAPIAARSLNHRMNSPGHFALSFPTVIVASLILGPLAFNQFPRWSDLLVAGLLYVGMFPESLDTLTSRPRTPTSKLIKLYMKTILSNPESRKIFYFLCLNLCYMLVQMLYGVWTNSLGLISDAIHMAFDCMAIGVGLFASVMATWEPNERFTYGYGRIETLSGFANGIFLILISIFIVFEAIQRILEPPEMNTSQLLLVSSVGLGVNLFGMFAMGGHHHHHGHSHGHGHGHGEHSHGHEHSHSHSVSPSSPSPALDSHSHSYFGDDLHLNPSSDNHSHSQLPLSASHSHVEFPRSDVHSSDHAHSDHSQHTHPRALSFTSTPLDKSTHQRSVSLAHKPISVAPLPPTLPLSTSSPSSLLTPSSVAHLHLQKHNPGHSRSSSLQIHTGPGGVSQDDEPSPLTPNYNFVRDEHMEQHHQDEQLCGRGGGGGGGGHEGHSHNMRGVFLHVMADTLGSVGVIISTLLIQFYGWTGFDPIASLLIAVLIAASVIPLVLDTGRILALDVSDKDVKIQEALSELSSIPGLQSYTNPRFWPKDASTLIGSIHIQLVPLLAAAASLHGPMSPDHDSNMRTTTFARVDRVIERVKEVLKGRIEGLEEVVVQVEEGTNS